MRLSLKARGMYRSPLVKAASRGQWEQHMYVMQHDVDPATSPAWPAWPMRVCRERMAVCITKNTAFVACFRLAFFENGMKGTRKQGSGSCSYKEQ